MIQRDIDIEILKGGRFDPERKRSGRYNPSQLGRCYRLQVLNRLNLEPTNPLPLSSLKAGVQGTMTHELNQKYLPKEMCEVEIKTEHFSGRADIVEEDCVSDIKSTDEWKIKRYWLKPIEVLLRDKREAFLQCGWYALQLKKPYTRIYPTPFGTIIDKEYTILTETVREEIEKEESNLIRYWEEGRLPEPKPRAFGGNGCNYCQYEKWCVKHKKMKTIKEVK